MYWCKPPVSGQALVPSDFLSHPQESPVRRSALRDGRQCEVASKWYGIVARRSQKETSGK
jgi:hypothetical protein